MRRSWSLVVALLIGSFGLLGMGCANAQDYPAKPIRLIVPNSPGTNSDAIARFMAAEMKKFLGQPIVVENKPGADSIIGYQYVAKQAPADGYTVVVAILSGLATLPLNARDLQFNPLKDLTPVVDLAEGKLILGSFSKAPWKTFSELVTYARANPEKVMYGSSAPYLRLLTEVFVQDQKVNVVHIPYPSAGPYFLGVLAGDVHMGFVSESSAKSFGEKFRALAVTGEQRSVNFADAPTFTQLGIGKMQGLIFSLNVRAGTPKSVIDKLYSAASRALLEPEAKTFFAKMELDIVNATPEASARHLEEQGALYADISNRIEAQPKREK